MNIVKTHLLVTTTNIKQSITVITNQALKYLSVVVGLVKITPDQNCYCKARRTNYLIDIFLFHLRQRVTLGYGLILILTMKIFFILTSLQFKMLSMLLNQKLVQSCMLGLYRESLRFPAPRLNIPLEVQVHAAMAL